MSRAIAARTAWDRRSPRRARVRSMHPRGVRIAIAGCTSIVVLAACGSPTQGTADIEVLADRAERLAEHLEAGEGCRAEREGRWLVALTRDAVAAEHVPAAVGEEVRDVVAEVTEAVPCDDGDDAPTEEEREEAEGAPEQGEEDPEEGPEEGPEESPEEPAEEPEEGSGGGSGNGGSGNGNSEEGPPGRSEDGPPGQRSSGRGRG